MIETKISKIRNKLRFCEVKFLLVQQYDPLTCHLTHATSSDQLLNNLLIHSEQANTLFVTSSSLVYTPLFPTQQTRHYNNQWWDDDVRINWNLLTSQIDLLDLRSCSLEDFFRYQKDHWWLNLIFLQLLKLIHDIWSFLWWSASNAIIYDVIIKTSTKK